MFIFQMICVLTHKFLSNSAAEILSNAIFFRGQFTVGLGVSLRIEGVSILPYCLLPIVHLCTSNTAILHDLPVIYSYLLLFDGSITSPWDYAHDDDEHDDLLRDQTPPHATK